MSTASPNDNYPDGTWASDPDAPWNGEEGAEVIDLEHEADVVRRMAVAQALHKVVAAEVKTGVADNLRGEFDALMWDRYERAKAIGAPPKTLDVELDGEKVGTYSFTTSAAEPARTEVHLQVENRSRLLEWALDHGFADVDMRRVEAHFADTGDVPDGCLASPVNIPAKPARVTRTSLRVDPAKVARSLGGELGDAVAYMLEGGE